MKAPKTNCVEILHTITSVLITPKAILVLSSIKRRRFIEPIFRPLQFVNLIDIVADDVKFLRFPLEVIGHFGSVHDTDVGEREV